MKGQVVVITGGTSGIGKALAHEFGKVGSKIVITGRRQEVLDEASSELRKSGIDILSIQSDVSKEEDCQKVAEETVAAFGKIDILINNAGISMRAVFEDLELDVIRTVMEINFFGAVNMTKYCLPQIIENKGSIVGISSIAGFRGLPGRTGYSASKFALQGFLEALRTELVFKDVNVLTVAPGFIATNIRSNALNASGNIQAESPREETKMMTAEECANHIYKAIRKRKKYLVLTSQGKLTVFLNKWAPGWMDKMVFKTMAKEPGAPFSVP